MFTTEQPKLAWITPLKQALILNNCSIKQGSFGVQIGDSLVHLQLSLLKTFILLFKIEHHFKQAVQIFELKRIGNAPI